jgi:Tol biopolymer transport system component
MLLTACGDDSDATPQSPTAESSRLPVVLQSNVRVTAAADGGNVREEPITDFELVADPTVSPDRSLRLVVDDGEVRIEPLDGGERIVLEGVGAEPASGVNAIWSPLSDRVMFDVATDGSSAVYAVSADGSGLVDVGEGLTGDAFPLAWAEDGLRLAFGVFAGDATSIASTLYVTEADGSGRIEAGPFLQPQGDAGWDRPRFSPDASRIAAFATTSSGVSLRVFDLAGGPAIDLDNEGVLKFSWSPDGQSLAFDRSDPTTQRSTVAIWDTASGETRELTEGFWPRWSPDGGRIAFKRAIGDGVESQIYTIRPDGSDGIAIGTPARYAFYDLTWSDDGEELTYIRPAFSAAQLYRVDLDAGSANPLGAPMGEAGNPPRSVFVAPDASEAAYLLNAFDPGGTWQLMDLANGATTPLVANGFPFADVHWTSQGPRVAVGGTSAAVTEPGGTELRSLDTGMAHKVVFSPDGSKLAVLILDTLLVAAVDGPDRTEIFQGAQGDVVQDVDWAPAGGRLTFHVTHKEDASGRASTSAYIADLDGDVTEIDGTGDFAGPAYWSPDGKTLAHVRQASSTDPYELWLLDADGANARMLASAPGLCCERLHWSPDGSRVALSRDLSSVALVDVVTGAITTAVTTGGGCNISIVGWSADGVALYVYPACYLGI